MFFVLFMAAAAEVVTELWRIAPWALPTLAWITAAPYGVAEEVERKLCHTARILCTNGAASIAAIIVSPNWTRNFSGRENMRGVLVER